MRMNVLTKFANCFAWHYEQPSHSVRTLLIHKGDWPRCSISGDGTRVMSTVAYVKKADEGSNHCNVHGCIIEPNTGKFLHKFGEGGQGFTTSALAGDGLTFVTADKSGSIAMYDASEGHELIKFKEHTNLVHDVSYRSDQRKLASASWDKTVRVWDIADESARECVEFTHRQFNYTNAIDLTADGRLVYIACNDNLVHACDINSGKESFYLKGHESPVMDCSSAKHGNTVVACSADGILLIWDIRKPEVLLRKSLGTFLDGCDITADGRRVIVCGKNGRAECFDFNPSTGYTMQFKDSSSLVNRCVLSDEGNRAVTVGENGNVRIFNLEPFSASGQREHQAIAPTKNEENEDSVCVDLSSCTADASSGERLKVDGGTTSGVAYLCEPSEPPDINTQAGTAEGQIGFEGKRPNIVTDVENVSDIEQRIANIDFEHEHLFTVQIGEQPRSQRERIDRIKSLSVAELCHVMCDFVCRPLSTERASLIRKRIQENMEECGISGRGVLLQDIGEDKIAQIVLYGQAQEAQHIENNFMYHELQDFLKSFRRGYVDFELSQMDENS